MKPFDEVRESLLRAGVAPRHVRRYIDELQDHLADLTAEEQHRGLSRENAQSAALSRLGRPDVLTKALLDRRHFPSWCVRAPWIAFGVMPLAAMGAIYFIACSVLWFGWKAFLPGMDTPFIPVHGVAAIYFGAGRFLYYAAPILVGWAVGLIAARQRSSAKWPVLACAFAAFLGSVAQVHADGPVFAGGAGSVSMSLNLSHGFSALSRSCVHFAIAALPYLVWLVHKALAVSAAPRAGD